MSQNLTFKDVIKQYEAFIIDNNIIYNNGQLNPYAVEVVKFLLSKKIVIFVCNTIESGASVCARLQLTGLDVNLDQVITSGDITKLVLIDSKHPLIGKFPTVFNFGDASFFNGYDEWQTNIILTEDITQAKLLLLTKEVPHDEDLNPYNDFLKQAVEQGCTAICVDSTETSYFEGKLQYSPGHFAKVYHELGGRVVHMGKPDKMIFYKALIGLAKQNIKEKSNIIVLANDYIHDVIGAHNVGIDSAMVRNSIDGKYFIEVEYQSFTGPSRINDILIEEILPNYAIDFTLN